MSNRKSYAISFKLKAVESASKKLKQVAAREFEVDTKRIGVWCSQKEELLALKGKGKSQMKRLKGAGCKAKDVNMEEALFSWVMDLRDRNLRVSCGMIRLDAKELSKNEAFKASRGWPC